MVSEHPVDLHTTNTLTGMAGEEMERNTSLDTDISG